LTSLTALGAVPARAQVDTFHILLTNDDGIESPGIQVLAEKLRAVGEVHLVAPCGERSGSSASVNLRQAVELRDVERDGVPLGQCVNSTPAGAVLFAVTTLAPEGGFDLVLSGINRGANVGDLSHMSGTVGGAMLGGFYGIPAVAASLGTGRGGFDYAARFVAEFVEELKGRPAMPGIVFSINVPNVPEADIAGVRIVEMGGSYMRFNYDEVEGEGEGRHFRPRIESETAFPEGSDTQAFMANSITITPLLFDWTAKVLVDQLRGWGLTQQVGR
jgi:5'-nucleotidase